VWQLQRHFHLAATEGRRRHRAAELSLRLLDPHRDLICATLSAGGDSMKNVEMSISGTILTITVDLSKEFGPSSSGKTIIIASTEGNISVPDREEKVGLNVYRKK
jgi:hypothetical protein